MWLSVVKIMKLKSRAIIDSYVNKTSEVGELIQSVLFCSVLKRELY